MVIYAEYVVVDNMAFDCLILWAAALTLRIKIKPCRIALGGAVGTGCAFLTLVLTSWWGVLVKIACLFLMCFAAAGLGKKLFWHILLTTAYTFMLGGAVVGIFYLTGTDFSAGMNLSYTSRVPLGVYVAAAALFAFLVYSLYKFVKAVRDRQPYLRKAKVYIGKDALFVTGYCDSGNTLEYDKIPVCFAMKSLRKRLSAEIADKVLHKQAVLISYSTMSGESQAYAVKTKLELFEKEYEIFLALPRMSGATEYAVLMNASFLEVQDDKPEKVAAKDTR